MIDAFLTQGGNTRRRYVLASPATVRRLDRVEPDGTPTFSDDTVIVTEVTVEIPQQWEHSITVPAVLVTGTGPDVNVGIGAYPAAVPWDQALADLGLQLAPGEPPPPPQPFLVGAVPNEADLPGDPPNLGVFLVRSTGIAHCVVDGEHRDMPWAPDCEEFFGLTADQVPDLPIGES